jgi:carbonic anhydrase
MRRFLITYFLLAVIGVTTADFGYDDNAPNGPSNWGKISQNCLGKQQTPINLDYRSARYLTFPALKLTNFDVKPKTVKVVNSGQSAVYSLNFENNFKATVSGGPLDELYIVDHFHLHWGPNSTVGSEHFIDGKQYPAELHIVSYNSKYSSVAQAINYPNGLAVLGIMYLVDNRANSESRSNNIRLNSENLFLSLLPYVVEANSEYETNEHIFSLNDILKNIELSYFSYKGSLTTPTCDEAVNWIVFRDPLLIRENDLKSLRQLKTATGGHMIRNYRPLQKLNHRFLLRNC